jgi:hypothetical protein
MSVERRFSWDEVANVIRNNDVDSLGRLPPDLAYYDKINQQLKQEFEAVDDHILHRVFGFPCVQDETTGKKKVIREPLKVSYNKD